MKKQLADILAALELATEGAKALLSAIEDDILTEAEARDDLAEISRNIKAALP